MPHDKLYLKHGPILNNCKNGGGLKVLQTRFVKQMQYPEVKFSSTCKPLIKQFIQWMENSMKLLNRKNWYLQLQHLIKMVTVSLKYSIPLLSQPKMARQRSTCMLLFQTLRKKADLILMGGMKDGIKALTGLVSL